MCHGVVPCYYIIKKKDVMCRALTLSCSHVYHALTLSCVLVFNIALSSLQGSFNVIHFNFESSCHGMVTPCLYHVPCLCLRIHGNKIVSANVVTFVVLLCTSVFGVQRKKKKRKRKKMRKEKVFSMHVMRN